MIPPPPPPPPAPPAIEQPAAHQVSYGLVTGLAAAGTRRLVVSSGARELADLPLRQRRFTVRVELPPGDTTVRVTTVNAVGRRLSREVGNVFGLPQAASPRLRASRADAALARDVRRLVAAYPGTAGVYVQSLTSGAGAAWNARARFPAASTLKVAVAVAALASHEGVPLRGSAVDVLLRKMLTHSDNAAANALEIWLAGSTSAGAHRVNALLQSIGIRETIMYGGYIVRSPAGSIPLRVETQPAWGRGKHTTALDLASLARAVWLASSGVGPLPAKQPGFTSADARYLLYLLAHVRDSGKLGRELGHIPGVRVLHKGGWIDTARHDFGLVFWRGGAYVASILTWNGRGAGIGADVLAGHVARVALERFRG